MWFVYVLLCEDGSFYTGVSNDIDKRFLTHAAGRGAKYTRSHRPVKIVYSEALENRSAALKREHEIKTWDRATKIAELKLLDF